MHAVLQDVRFAARVLRKNPGYTIVALLTLALGIGANTAVFSLVNGALLRPLPYPESDRLVRIWEVNSRGGSMQAAWQNFADWRERSTSFTNLVAHSRGGPATVLGTGVPLRVGTTAVSEGFLRMLGIVPMAGRDLGRPDHERGAAPGVLISHRFWQTYLGGAPDFAGRRLQVSSLDATIVGVAPPGFDYPSGTDVWYPLELVQSGGSRTSHNYAVIGRLVGGATLGSAAEELGVITARFADADPGVREEDAFADFFPVDVRVETMQSWLVGDSRRPLFILLGASVLLLLVACTNLASTGLARGTRRTRELSVRQALGAGMGRLTRLLFTEAALLTALGAAFGLGVASLVLRLVPILAPEALPAHARLELSPAVLAFTFVAAAVTAVLVGLAPAMRYGRRDFFASLRGGRGAGAATRSLLWRGLIASEVALSLVLLIGCGLLVRSFIEVLSTEPGFETENILTATFNPPSTKYPDGDARVPFYETLLAELERMPGVRAAGLIAAAPMSGVGNGLVDIDDGPRPTAIADYQLVSPGYFAALRIPLVSGRLFEPTDLPGTEHVVLVNQTLADLAWPGEDPIGKRMTAGGMDDYWEQDKWATVVGVVGDIRQQDLTRPPDPTYYFSFRQRPFRSWSMTAVLAPEASGTAGMGPAVREVARTVDPDVPVTLSMMDARVGSVLSERRFTLLVLAGFAVVALLLACIGIYGVVAYSVALRTREIGIRIALGARPASVRRLVQQDTIVDMAIGGGIGLVLAFALTRVLQSLLYEVSATDPMTFVGVLAALGGAGWLASFVPALRSTRVDPVQTMRAD